MDGLIRSSAMGNHGQGPARKERSGILRNLAKEGVGDFRIPKFNDNHAQMSTVVWSCVLFELPSNYGSMIWANEMSQLRSFRKV